MQVVVDRLKSTTDLHVYLSPMVMNRLQLEEEDVIKIASPARKFIIVAVSSKNFRSSDNCICIGRNYRQLLECYLGEAVQIEPFKHCQTAKTVVLAPISDTMNNLTGNFLNIILSSNYDFHNIPVWKDMVIPIYAMQHVFEFQVISCAPISAVIVTDPSVIQCQNTPVERAKSPVFDKLCYDDIGGVDRQLTTVRKLVENPRTSSALVVAPSGCGKTYLANIIRNETKSHFEFIPSLELLGMTYEKGKGLLYRVLEVTSQNTPAIVYIDDLDAIASHQNYNGDQRDDRLVNALGDFIEKLRKMPNVLILATIKSIEDLRQDFHPPTRFNETIRIELPGKEERADILRAMTRKMTLTSSSAIDDMASMTEGQTPSDLLLICQKTILSHLSYLLSLFDLSNPNVPLEDLKEIAVGQGVYAASRNRRKKNAKKDNKGKKKKGTKANPLDPFGDLLSKQRSDDSDDDSDRNDEENDMFSIGGTKKRPQFQQSSATSSSLQQQQLSSSQQQIQLQSSSQQNSSKNSLKNQQQLQKPVSTDDMFDFGQASKPAQGQGSNVDIFGAAPTLQSSDPFGNSKNDPFAINQGGNSSSGLLTGFTTATASGSIGITGTTNTLSNDPFGQPSSSSPNSPGDGKAHRHRKHTNDGDGDGDSSKKHKKHKKHKSSSKKDDSSSTGQPQVKPPNPFQMSSGAANNDPFAVSTTNQTDPFGASNAANKANNDPFGQQPVSKAGSNNKLDPFGNNNKADPFSQPSGGNQNDPFGQSSSSKPQNDPFGQSSSSKPQNDPFGSKQQNDPFGQPISSSSGKQSSKKSVDPFSSSTQAADPFSASSSSQAADPFGASTSKAASSAASDPFAPPSGKSAKKVSNDPFSSSSANQAADPFASPQAASGGKKHHNNADPFAMSSSSGGKANADPFANGADPFASSSASKASNNDDPFAPAPKKNNADPFAQSSHGKGGRQSIDPFALPSKK